MNERVQRLRTQMWKHLPLSMNSQVVPKLQKSTVKRLIVRERLSKSQVVLHPADWSAADWTVSLQAAGSRGRERFPLMLCPDSAGFEGAQEISAKRDRWSDITVSTAVDTTTRSLSSSAWRDEMKKGHSVHLLLKDCYLHKWRSGKINRLAKSAVQLKGASASSHSVN